MELPHTLHKWTIIISDTKHRNIGTIPSIGKAMKMAQNIYQLTIILNIIMILIVQTISVCMNIKTLEELDRSQMFVLIKLLNNIPSIKEENIKEEMRIRRKTDRLTTLIRAKYMNFKTELHFTIKRIHHFNMKKFIMTKPMNPYKNQSKAQYSN
jgi:hypothetical protein